MVHGEPQQSQLRKRAIYNIIGITLLLYGVYGYIVADMIKQYGCTLNTPCEGLELSVSLLVFSIFKTFLILLMIFRFNIFKINNFFSLRYFLFFIVFILLNSFLKVGFINLFFYYF